MKTQSSRKRLPAFRPRLALSFNFVVHPEGKVARTQEGAYNRNILGGGTRIALRTSTRKAGADDMDADVNVLTSTVSAELAKRIETYDRPVRPEYRYLADLRLSNPLLSVRDLAKALGRSENTIRAWLVRPDYSRFEHWVFERDFRESGAAGAAGAEAVQERFQEYAGEMQERLLAILDETEDARLATQIAHDWLDRAGHSPVRKQLNAGVQLHLSAEAVTEIMRRRAEAGLIEGEVVGNAHDAHGHPVNERTT
jgi:transposase